MGAVVDDAFSSPVEVVAADCVSLLCARGNAGASELSEVVVVGTLAADATALFLAATAAIFLAFVS